MANVDLDVFGQRVERFVHEVLEEDEILEDGLVALLQVLLFEVGRQVLEEGLLLLDVEVLLDVDALLDVVADLPLELVGQVVLVGQLLERLRVLELLDVLRADVADEGADRVDVVGEAHHAHDLDEDQAERLLVVRGRDVSEANGQHDVAAPVVGPDVLLKPARVLYPDHAVPGLFFAGVRHGREQYGQNVGKDEVEDEDLQQRPVLLVVVVLDEVDFELLQLFEALGQLGDDEEPQVEHRLDLLVVVYEQDQQAQDVDGHVGPAVVLEYFSVSE